MADFLHKSTGEDSIASSSNRCQIDIVLSLLLFAVPLSLLPYFCIILFQLFSTVFFCNKIYLTLLLFVKFVFEELLCLPLVHYIEVNSFTGRLHYYLQRS